MPVNPLDLIVPGAGIVSAGINAAAQGANNRKSRKWNEKMYAQQRADNERQWHMQNEYNSPEAVMARLKAGGLNPNMVYGHGQATQPAGSIDSASAPTWSPRAPQVDLQPVAAGGIATYYDVQMKQAQIDNMKTQNTVLVNEALLKLAQMASLQAGTEKTKLDTRLGTSLFDNTLAMAQENLRKLTFETEISATKSFVADNTADADVQAKRALATRLVNDIYEQSVRIKGMSKDVVLKTLEVQLRKNGINPNDPIYMRMLGQLLSDKFNIQNFKF